MERVTYIKIKPVEQAGMNANCVQVGVSHHKTRKAVFLNLYPAEDIDGRVILADGQNVKVEDMVRLNNKRLDLHFEQLKKQVESKSGDMWDAVVKFLVERNYTLEDS